MLDFSSNHLKKLNVKGCFKVILYYIKKVLIVMKMKLKHVKYNDVM